MSTDAKLTLGEYIVSLVDVLKTEEPAGFARMREIVEARAARIELDEEAVEVVFVAGQLHVASSLGFTIEGSGSTDTATVLDLLDGDLEVSAAVLDGRLRLFGDSGDIARMCIAIEILLNASARCPGLQALAARFRREHDRTHQHSRYSVAWYPFACSDTELALLKRLDLLPARTES
jgi:putative sterol carrier protein